MCFVCCTTSCAVCCFNSMCLLLWSAWMRNILHLGLTETLLGYNLYILSNTEQREIQRECFLVSISWNIIYSNSALLHIHIQPTLYENYIIVPEKNIRCQCQSVSNCSLIIVNWVRCGADPSPDKVNLPLPSPTVNGR